MSITIDQHTWYRDSLHQLDEALYGPAPTQHRAPIELGGRQYTFNVWQGEQLPDQLLAYDTETTAIRGREIPQLALATVYGDVGSAYLIHPDRLPQFIEQHAGAYFCCHNAAFDFWVTSQHLGTSQANLLWWDMAGDGRLCCTMILDALIRLARIDAEPVSRGLDVVAKEYCGLKLDKDDPYRLRYGELVGLNVDEWSDVDGEFWQYACKDPVATLLVMKQQGRIAKQLTARYRGQLLSDAWRRFGPLTACLQVQGAIALDYVSRVGISVDLQRTGQLHNDVASLVKKHMAELEQLGGNEIFRRFGPRSKKAGQLQLSASGVARRNAKLIKQKLQDIAQASDEPIRPPRNKDGLVTDSVKYWKQHQHLDPFIAAYVSFSEQAKLMQFFAKLNESTIHPRYRALVRTGRTSCSDPNLQQLPRDSRFREMIVAPSGFWLLQIDYSVLELRTLAQICLRRYGQSVLAELFRQAVDPHKYTAALLLGMTLEQFGELPLAEQKQHRQRAKAINFGVPGGLGAVSLVAYAKQSYGVEMTIDEAKAFRKRLITQVYPELQTYLRDNQQQDLADNLQCSLASVRSVFGRREQIQDAARIISGCDDSQAGDPYPVDLVRYIWLCLQQLNQNPELQASLLTQKPSSELMRRVFYGSAVTLSGRLRGHVGFSQRANSPFQGLAADGNKLALYRLLRAGFQVCGFVHDEMLVLIPNGTDYDTAVGQVQQILIDSMQEFTPDIPIESSYLLADRWYKDVDDQPRNSEGIIPYQRQCELRYRYLSHFDNGTHSKSTL